MTDHINPQHYRSHPSGVECIEITEHMNFCLGNAVKYIWRAGLKSDDPVEDLRKARWYITRELDRLGAERVVRPYATGGVLNALNKLNDQLAADRQADADQIDWARDRSEGASQAYRKAAALIREALGEET